MASSMTLETALKLPEDGSDTRSKMCHFSNSAPELQLAFAVHFSSFPSADSTKGLPSSSKATDIPSTLAYRDFAMDSYVSIVIGYWPAALIASILLEGRSGHLISTRFTCLVDTRASR